MPVDQSELRLVLRNCNFCRGGFGVAALTERDGISSRTRHLLHRNLCSPRHTIICWILGSANQLQLTGVSPRKDSPQYRQQLEWSMSACEKTSATTLGSRNQEGTSGVCPVSNDLLFYLIPQPSPPRIPGMQYFQ